MSVGRRIAAALAFAAALAGAIPAAAQSRRFDWDAIGAAYCQRALAGDLRGLAPLLTPSLAQALQTTLARAGAKVPPSLLQSYSNPAPVCAPRTRNVALVEVRRSGPGGAAPAWTDRLVIVPQADGTNRIDDILFATRRSDTLRTRLDALAKSR
jgi:hypothetical protein